uniref:Protein kinase domain-containing protein n=1 Tax=Salix viminalis TaxID=40686 RepID=A0A6N2KGX2_SALVM
MDLIRFFIAHLFISGFLGNEDDPPASTSSFSLQRGQSKTISAPASWGCPFGGHTYCTEESTGSFSCITGDCGSVKLECSGNGMATSTKLEEFKLDDSGGLFYSFLNANLVVPSTCLCLLRSSDQNCKGTVGCVVDLNGAYPSELRVNSTSDGEIDACKRVCQGFKIDYQIIFCAAKTTTSRRRLDSTTTSTTVSVNASANGADSKSESTATSPTSSARASAQGSNSESSATVITSNVTEKTPSLVSFPPSPLPDEKSPSPSPKIRPRRWGGESEKNEDLEAYGIRQVPGTPVRFSYEDLRVATHDFSDTLGKGGSGSVFKGVLRDGTHVAVKKLEKLDQDMSSFLAEVEAIGSIQPF